MTTLPPPMYPQVMVQMWAGQRAQPAQMWLVRLGFGAGAAGSCADVATPRASERAARVRQRARLATRERTPSSSTCGTCQYTFVCSGPPSALHRTRSRSLPSRASSPCGVLAGDPRPCSGSWHCSKNDLETVTSRALALAFTYPKLPFFSAVQPTSLHTHSSSTPGCELPP